MVKDKKSAAKRIAKQLFSDYKEKLWALVVKFIEEEVQRLGGWLKDITHLKQKIRKLLGAFVVLMGGVIMVLLGLGELVSDIFRWHTSVSYIFVGFIAIIVAMIYNKT